jgi:hypothetical protein
MTTDFAGYILKLDDEVIFSIKGIPNVVKIVEFRNQGVGIHPNKSGLTFRTYWREGKEIFKCLNIL